MKAAVVERNRVAECKAFFYAFLRKVNGCWVDFQDLGRRISGLEAMLEDYKFKDAKEISDVIVVELPQIVSGLIQAFEEIIRLNALLQQIVLEEKEEEEVELVEAGIDG